MAELATHMEPVLEELKHARDWRLGFWSNGSKDRPIGFFQRRMQQDDERNAQLNKDLEKQTAIADRLDKYVAAQITRREYLDKQLMRLWTVVKWVGPIVGTAILGLATWVGPHALKAAQIIWQDYLQAHPAVTQKLKNDVGTDAQPAYSQKQKPPEESSTPYAPR